MLHRTRDLLIRQRSSLISAIRAHFAEFGIVVGQGIRNVERLLALLETAGDQRLPALAAEMLGILAVQLRSASATRAEHRSFLPQCSRFLGSGTGRSARSRSTQ